MEKIHEDFEWKNYRIKLHNLREDQKDRILQSSYIIPPYIFIR